MPVGGDFFHPEQFVVHWLAKAFRTAMPKTAIDENGNPIFSENKVRSSRKLGMPPPPSDPVGTKQSNERQLGALVATATNP